MKLIYKVFNIDSKAYGYNPQTRRFKIVMSDESVDHDGDILDQAGWQFNRFAKNPVMPWCHDYSTLPVAKAVSYQVQDKRLVLEGELAPTEQGDEIAKYLAAGFPLMGSVGFDPLELEPIYEENENGYQQRCGTHFHKQELIEASLCPIGSNANAVLQQATLAKAIDSIKDDHSKLTKALEELSLPKKELDELQAQISNLAGKLKELDEKVMQDIKAPDDKVALLKIPETEKKPEKAVVAEKQPVPAPEKPQPPAVKVVKASPLDLAILAEKMAERKIKLAQGGIIGGNVK